MSSPVPNLETARALVANDLLWPRVSAFLWDFAPLIHPSHLSRGKAVEKDAAPRLKKYILSAHDVEPCFHDFPADDGSRLLLLDAETFDSLAKWTGALALADGLRRAARREDVLALREGLAGVYPALFGYEAYFRGGIAAPAAAPSGGADPIPTAADAVSRGYALLSSLLSPLPAPLLHRLHLRLPAGTPWPADGAALPPGSLPLSRVLLLLKLKFPEASALCSS